MPHRHKRNKMKSVVKLINGILVPVKPSIVLDGTEEEEKEFDGETPSLTKDQINRIEKEYFQRKRAYLTDKISFDEWWDFKMLCMKYLRTHGSSITVEEFDSDYEVNCHSGTLGTKKQKLIFSTGPEDMLLPQSKTQQKITKRCKRQHKGDYHYGRYENGVWQRYDGWHWDKNWVKTMETENEDTYIVEVNASDPDEITEEEKAEVLQEEAAAKSQGGAETVNYPYYYDRYYDDDGYDYYGTFGDPYNCYGKKGGTYGKKYPYGHYGSSQYGQYGGYGTYSTGAFGAYNLKNCEKYKRFTYLSNEEKERIKESMKHWDPKRTTPNPWLIVKPEVKQKMDLLCALAGTYEIAWNGFIRIPEGYTRDQNVFELYDVIVYPQIVTGATSETDEDTFGDWFANTVFPRPDFNNMRFHGHSHVNMGCSPSSTDRTYRDDTLKDMEENDFFFFGIYNKKGEYTMELYDATYNICWETADIHIYVGDSLPQVMESFNWAQKQVIDMCHERKTYVAPAKKEEAAAKTEEKKETGVTVVNAAAKENEAKATEPATEVGKEKEECPDKKTCSESSKKPETDPSSSSPAV